MKNKKLFLLNLIYFTALSLIAVLFVLSYFGFISNDWLSSILIQIIVMAAIPILMYKLMFKKSFKTTMKHIGFKRISTKSILIIILLGFALYFLNSYIATFFSTIISMFGYEKLSFSQSQTNITYGLLLKELLLTAILPAICEEILHRGIMLNCAKRTYNPRFCLLISSILFGLTHLNINQFFYAAILGFLMGYVNLVCDSIIPSIIIHFMNNFLSIYFSYGNALDWPLATFIHSVETFISSNIVVFVAFTSITFVAILGLYSILVKTLAKERARSEIQNIVNCLQLNKLSIEAAQVKINQVNQILKEKDSFSNKMRHKKATCLDNLFLISSIILGVSVTICSFIWGII